jgi:Superfamily II DNA helicase
MCFTKTTRQSYLSTLTSRNLISFVVVDEIHLYTRYGLTFRSEFMKLKNLLFQKLPSVTPMLFLTATCTDTIRQAFEKLTGVFINNLDWPSGIAMGHRTVGLELKYTIKTTATSIAAVKITLLLNDNLPKKVIVYAETRGRCTTFQERLGKALDEEETLHKHDVIELLGTMPKEKKTKLIESFMDEDGPSILCATY